MKFKKHISVFLAILFLVSNVGFALYVHYCGDTVSSISLNSNTSLSSLQDEKGCCQKITSKKDSCCKDKKIIVQKKAIDKIFKTISFQFDSVFLVTEYQSVVFNAVTGFKNNVSLLYYCDANAPPLYKLYSQYLLYDRV
ncbi:HYC_CC_PP family protein [Flavobacterium sp. WC2509]|uniref:HYC_CC_PP family protein n=1 Tax=Flavobacterium sp. WC2509 TaxID=3461406 RepID=UPI0040441EC1